MNKEERAEIKRQVEIEKILGRFIGDSDLHESCQALLDCLPAALKGEATPLDISEDAMRRMTR